MSFGNASVLGAAISVALASSPHTLLARAPYCRAQQRSAPAFPDPLGRGGHNAGVPAAPGRGVRPRLRGMAILAMCRTSGISGMHRAASARITAHPTSTVRALLVKVDSSAALLLHPYGSAIILAP